MEYKGYLGNVIYDDKARVFHGDVINTRDVITFEGVTVDELEQAFHDSVDDYIEWCRQDGVEPEKPYSGSFVVRISPELHRRAAAQSAKENLSLNKFVEKSIEAELAQVM